MYQDDHLNQDASEAPDTPAGSADAGQAAEAIGVADTGRAGLTASFLAEIARAMRATAIQERERITATVADGTVAHEQKVRERGASEASELRKLADDDVTGIERTSAEEIERIKTEAERRIGERRGELADHLERHAALIESEIGRVRGAVDDYGAELDGFFGRLAEEQNPAEIARLAGLLPEPPDLDQIGATARADAVNQIADEETEPAEPARTDGDLVGVMGPEAGTPVFDDSPEPAAPEPVPAGAIADDGPGEETTAADAPSSGGISAATLLRNLAPWTNPDRPSDNTPH
jgi:hypothetical protein